MKQRSAALAWMILIALILSACNLPGRSTGPGASTLRPEDAVNTAAAKTVAALGTQLAGGKNPTLVGPQSATITSAATVTLTTTPVPVKTITPTPGEDCNAATYVRDVTIPDGSTILPNSSFTKVWELKNTGSCTWNSTYTVVFAGKGQAMSGNATAPVVTQGEVKPGESASVSVTMRAPGEAGEYEGYWMLRSGDNKTFGTGPNHAVPFFVKIRVADQYSFAEHTCSAQWSSAAGDLPCPGKEEGNKGFVVPVKNPTLEDNKEHEGLGMLVMPQAIAGGYIVGKFPAVIVPQSADFRAVLGCSPSATGCYTKFKVTYRVDNGDEVVLGEWNEGTDGNLTNAIKDLNNVGGRSVAFYFYVYVNGTPDQNKVIWFDPKIVKN